MMLLKSTTDSSGFIRKYPVLAYFVATFLISWGGVIAIIYPAGIPATPEQTNWLFPWALAAMLAGPFASGWLMTGLILGKPGARALVKGVKKWKVGLQWYAVALLLVPIFTGAILWILAQNSWRFVPNIITNHHKGELVFTGIAIGLVAGVFEEIGWTGFAVRLLKEKFRVVRTGLIVGLVWGLWHFLVTFWASGDASGNLSMKLLLPPLFFYIGVLPAYRVLMVWVYDRTESILVSVLMHASLTTSTIYLFIPPATGESLIKYYIVLTGALWLVIANLVASRSPVFMKKGAEQSQ